MKILKLLIPFLLFCILVDVSASAALETPMEWFSNHAYMLIPRENRVSNSSRRRFGKAISLDSLSRRQVGVGGDGGTQEARLVKVRRRSPPPSSSAASVQSSHDLEERSSLELSHFESRFGGKHLLGLNKRDDDGDGDDD
ncbi:hypothetical protein IE53DRAFT_370413 [Violaceomyces palustris]|uniref:Uncharacterized protein n=1 Tax=Violaceomyces palustris TaxID=1673888 RepID=A0ACD0NS69_9BASI|nr:hypothetical protein IE53DRAFT_370413 [Violaceomyces palustris]